MNPTPRIYLASRSPRRRELLHQIHVNFEVLLFRTGLRQDAEVSEDVVAGEAATAYVQRVARAKAHAGVVHARQRRLPAHPVLAADTTIELAGTIIGKPENPEHAVDILQQLSGRSHRVLTAVAVGRDDDIADALSESDVRFRPLDIAEIRRYVATGEPLDKAGAYAIQGRAAMYIADIRGSYSGIMGLPLFETAELLKRYGYPL